MSMNNPVAHVKHYVDEGPEHEAHVESHIPAHSLFNRYVLLAQVKHSVLKGPEHESQEE